MSYHPILLPFRFLACEFKCPAVLGDGADNVTRRAGRDLRLNLQRNRHNGADQAR